MKRARIAVVLCVVLAAAAALAATTSAADTKLYALATGAKEVPAKGDPDGSATVTLTLKRSAGQVCYVIHPKKLEKAQQAHIHKGKAGKSGPIKVTLFGSPKAAVYGTISGCAKHVDKTLIDDIKAKPSAYYFNVHTKKYPNGAVRGQLRTTKP